MLEDKAFKNRFDIYNFTQEINLNKKDIIKIKQEEAKIIIHCNKLYLKFKNKNKNKNKKKNSVTKLLT